MVGIVKEINGEKKIIPLTTDTGTGAAVGTLIQQYKKVPMSGYLYCDGSTFDQNDYPALYMYLGTNVLPDYRECVMVGAEQNTTDTIATHDVYGEGEFKDDQLQNITGSLKPGTSESTIDMEMIGSGAIVAKSETRNIATPSSVAYNAWVGFEFDASRVVRTGTTTHGKQKAVYVYIKATSGLAENQQENVLNDVKEYVDSSIDKTHPTIDLSKVFSNGSLNVYILYNTYGAGRYILLGQGPRGHATSAIDIWTLVSGAVTCIITTSYSNGTSGVAVMQLINSSNQTIVIQNEFINNANYMKKVCSFV